MPNDCGAGIDTASAVRLVTFPDRTGSAASWFRVRRVSDRDSAALRHLGELGVRPGVVLAVERHDPFGGPLWVRIDDRPCALGIPLTRLVHGDVLGDDHDLDEETP